MVLTNMVNSLSESTKLPKIINKKTFAMFKLFIECFTKKYFQFSGRAGRREYISFRIIIFVIKISLSIVILLLEYNKAQYQIKVIFVVLTIIFKIFYIIPYISLSMRRLHDMNLSGSWHIIFVTFLIILGIFYGKEIPILIHFFTYQIALMSIKGTNGPNKYGEQPR